MAEDIILDHGNDYDGIKEYDNPLPQWFVMMFYGCIVFAFLYMGYYTGKTWGLVKATGLSPNLVYSGTRYALLVREADKDRADHPFVAPQGAALMAFLKSPENISRGEGLFKANCVPCHGEQAQGIIGPNLTDKYWLHGGQPADIIHSISYGWKDKGMPTWLPVLGPEKVHWLAAYVLSLQGRHVDHPKPPQGVLVP